MENNQYNNNQFNNDQYNNNQQQGNVQYGQVNNGQPNGQSKQKILAILFAIFLGGLGIHHFYLGDNKKGLTYLLVSLLGSIVTCGIASIVIFVLSIIDAVKIYNGTIATDFYGNPII